VVGHVEPVYKDTSQKTNTENLLMLTRLAGKITMRIKE